MTKTQAISLKVLELVATGMTAKQALEVVCGKEAVDAMVNQLYDALRAKAGK